MTKLGVKKALKGIFFISIHELNPCHAYVQRF